MSLPRFSVENPVLVNMMMIVTLVAGAALYCTLIREMFPESRASAISITAVYPAVQPEELEKAITIKVEEAVREIDGVEKVESTVTEGFSRTILKLYNNVDDIDVVLQEVKNEVDALEDLPDDLEKITVTKQEPTLPVIMVAIFGDASEAEIKRAARDLKDDLLELPGISDIEEIGIRDDEISVEIRPERLLEYDITFEEIAAAIRATNIDISAGNLKGDRGNIAVRTLGEEQRAVDLEDIEVRSLSDGTTIRLADVAVVKDGFVDFDIQSYFNGKRSANLLVQKTPTQDAIEISTLIKAYVAGKRQVPFDPFGIEAAKQKEWYVMPFSLAAAYTSQTINKMSGRPDPWVVYEQSRQNPFDHTYEVALHTDLARFVEGRLDLMLRNGRAGLLLVLISLNLFLNWRVAMWTAVGLPVAFLGTFIVMWGLGATINLLSMFGLIIVLGIIVDDAIVIGENIYRRVEEGLPARQAAIEGAEEVFWPVTIAVTTTIAAFSPLLFISGQIGDFMRQLPIVVLAALSVSLAEALIILPSHLSHLPAKKVRYQDTEQPTSRIGRWLRRASLFQHGLMTHLLLPTYERFLRLTLRWRYVTVAVAVSACLMAMGLFMGKTKDGYSLGNIVPWEFVQAMDAESMYAILEMPVGSTNEHVRQRLQILSDVAMEMPEVHTAQMDVGIALSVTDVGATGGEVQPHLGQLWVELMAADEREANGLRSSDEILAELRRVSETLTGVNSITWEAMNGGPGGKDIVIRLSGDDFDNLKIAAGELIDELSHYAGVVDLDTNSDDGKREARLSLRESARPTGITVSALGGHVRAATYGAEARRITRNREDVKIMVRYPKPFREEIANIESMWIPAPASNRAPVNSPGEAEVRRAWVPLREVAELTEAVGYTTLHRSEQKRTITVFGEIDNAVTSSSDVIEKVRSEYVPALIKEHPGMRVEFLGATEEQGKAFGSLKVAFPVAMLLVYMLLAGLFRSYFQPLVVMAAIPFGIQGAIVGHWVTGNPMTILSMIGLVALTGILVNDSLVLVDFINSRIRSGMPHFEASVEGAKLRLRPILLTTLTTVAGLTPLMFEKSFQAKFLIPMAVTLTFGLMFATTLTLVIVPSLNMIFFDIQTAVSRFLSREPETIRKSDLELAASAVKS
ncbi:MAG: efflux RND transporter permease subunit [Planctomycetaceae bacterium]|nr:efflux RND transporter permease subunit [Planctomycetaceae bacterium]